MIWTVYAALLAVVFVALSVRTLRLRRRLRIAIGDGDNRLMLQQFALTETLLSTRPSVFCLCSLANPLGIIASSSTPSG